MYQTLPPDVFRASVDLASWQGFVSPAGKGVVTAHNPEIAALRCLRDMPSPHRICRPKKKACSCGGN